METEQIVTPSTEKKDKAKWIAPKALPLDTQLSIKEDIRKEFATSTKIQIARNLIAKYKIAQTTAWKYMNRVIHEDLRELNKKNIVMEIVSDRIFRKRQLLGLYTRAIQREEATKNLCEPRCPIKNEPDGIRHKHITHTYDGSIYKMMVLRQLADEDKLIVDLLQQLSIITKPTERFAGFFGVVGEDTASKLIEAVLQDTKKKVITIEHQAKEGVGIEPEQIEGEVIETERIQEV